MSSVWWKPGRGVLLVVVVGCATPESDSPDGLQPGTWVEAEGVITPDGPRVEKVVEQSRGDTDKASKIELTAPADSAEQGDRLRILGVPVTITDKTEYEGAERDAVPRFPIDAGAWLRLKLRRREDGELRARTIRQVTLRDRFDIMGELGVLDPERGVVEVGGIALGMASRLRLRTLEQQETESQRDDPLALFLADEQKGVPFTIELGDQLRLGGELSVDVEDKDEFDLSRARAGDRTSLGLEAKADLLWRFGAAGSFALLEGKVGRLDRFEEGDPDTTETSEQISRAYAYFKLTDVLRLQVGRQDFDEEREWLYDEILDGVRVRAVFDAIELEAFGAVGRDVLAPRNTMEDTSAFAGVARAYLTDDHFVSGYFLQRKDSSAANFEPYQLGLRSFARPWEGLGHWAEVAYSGGYDGFTKIGGMACDGGVMYRFDAAWRPTVTAGYAFGEGEGDASGRQGFRQSGLQDNNDKFGGVTSFRYYGEVFDPELTNLGVTTVAVGVRPARRLSIDVVWHTYRQDVASTRPRANARDDLRTRPNGQFRDLGQGLDLVIGYRVPRWLSTELVAARFEPGSGFDSRDAAHLFALQARVKF